MKQVFGKAFRTRDGTEYGIIRKTKEPFPEELSESDVIAEDGCGNYFVQTVTIQLPPRKKPC